MENFLNNIVPSEGEWGGAIFIVLYCGFILRLIYNSEGDSNTLLFWLLFMIVPFIWIMWNA